MQAFGVPGLRSPSRQAKHSCTEQRRRSRATVSCRALTVFSPSKVNLFLRITRRREDGFHDLASLFHVIDLGDTLEFNPTEAEADSLKCNVSDVPTDASNLVVKALDLFRKHTGAPHQLPAAALPDSLANSAVLQRRGRLRPHCSTIVQMNILLMHGCFLCRCQH